MSTSALRLQSWIEANKEDSTQLHVVALLMTGDQPVQYWNRAELPDSSTEIARRCNEAAQMDAEGREAVMRYAIRWQDDIGKVKAQTVIKAGPSDGPASRPAEDASSAGVVERFLRFQEGFHRQNHSNHQLVVAQLLQMNQQLLDERKQLVDMMRALCPTPATAGATDALSEAKAVSLASMADAVNEHIIPAIGRQVPAVAEGIGRALAKRNPVTDTKQKPNGRPVLKGKAENGNKPS